jgi:beta-lactamase regulating signal transducer with metallopeptidase domain
MNDLLTPLLSLGDDHGGWIITHVGGAWLQAAAMALVVLVLQLTIGNRLGPRWLALLWLLVLLRGALPVVPESSFSVFGQQPAIVKALQQSIPESAHADGQLADHGTGLGEAQTSDSRPLELAQDHTHPVLGLAALSMPMLEQTPVDPKPFSASPVDGFSDLLPIAALTWSVGLLVGFICVLVGMLRAYRLVQLSRLPHSPHLGEALRQACQRVGVHRPPEVRISPDGPTAALTIVPRPTLLLRPEVADMDRPLLVMVLSHELAHHRRYDAQATLLASLLLAAQFFNPVAWLALRQFRTAIELAADDLALRGLQPHHRHQYGALLIHLAETAATAAPSGLWHRSLRSLVLSVPMSAGASQLKRRILMLMTQARLGTGASTLSLLTVLVLLCGCVLGLSRPASGQPGTADAGSDDLEVAATAAPASVEPALAESTPIAGPEDANAGFIEVPTHSVERPVVVEVPQPKAPTATIELPLAVNTDRAKSTTIRSGGADLTKEITAAEFAHKQAKQQLAAAEEQLAASARKAEASGRIAERQSQLAEEIVRSRMESDQMRALLQRQAALPAAPIPPTPPAIRMTVVPSPEARLAKVRIKQLDTAEKPLRDLFDNLGDQTGTNIAVDWLSLEAAGVKPTTTVRAIFRDVALQDAIAVIGRLATGSDEAITVTTKGEVVIITSSHSVRPKLPTTVIDVSDIARGSSEDQANDAVRIRDLIVETVHPDGWVDRGGHNTLQAFSTKLIIAADQETVQAVSALLQQLRVAPAEIKK